MKIIQVMCVVLIMNLASAAEKKISKKGNVKFLPTPPPARPSRHSGVQDLNFDYLPVGAVGYNIQNEDTHTFITNLENAYNALTPEQQQVLLEAVRSSTTENNQPKTPVYHATPLEPYGALLDHREPSPVDEHKSSNVDQYQLSVLITPKPVEKGQDREVQSHSAYYTSSKHGKVTEAIIKEPKDVQLAHKTHDHEAQHYDEHEPKTYAAKYQFAYQVRDAKYGNYFGHTESRDGDHTNGNYHVLLPDGRLQNVKYWADHGGYHAHVSYNRAAKHPPSVGHHRQLQE